MRHPALPAVVLALAVATVALPAQPAPIVLRSGNVPAGNTEPAITYLQGPATAAFGFAFTAADFAAARTGPNALVLPSLAGGWPLQLPASPQAQWIDTAAGSHSALYAIPFQVTQTFASAVLTLQFVADDSLGDPAQAGVYVNELPVPDTSNVGSYYYVETLARGEIGPMLQQGSNWLYLYLHNTGGRGGLLFHASIQLDGGMLRRYGNGCAGSAGTPLLLPVGTPQPAAPVELRCYNLPTAPGLLALVLGLDGSTAFGMPTPVDLGFLGFPGCAAWCEPATAIAVPTVAGAALHVLTLPGPAYAARSIYGQAFVFDSAHPRGASVSNAVELRAGW